MRRTPEQDALTWQVAFVYLQDQPSQKETELGCREAAAGFRAGLLWRKEHPELLSGCLRPERNNKGEATRQKEHCLIGLKLSSFQEIKCGKGWHRAPRKEVYLTARSYLWF